jgi:hypothetical protein
MTPWLRGASRQIHEADKLMLCHTDGENCGLIDLLADCGMDIAEAVSPHPMTKLTLESYYRKWRKKKITIFGGIPSTILVPDACSDAEFEDYIKNIFTTLTPGDRFILGVADTTPPQAPIERLQHIGEIAKELGKLPLKPISFSTPPLTQAETPDKPVAVQTLSEVEGPFVLVQKLLLKGDQESLSKLCHNLMDDGLEAQDILNKGLLAAMEVISRKFKDNSVFIPEVLLSARAMNSVVKDVLGPSLLKAQPSPKVAFF